MGIDYSRKADVPSEVTFWPYDLVIEEKLHDRLVASGEATITLNPNVGNFKHSALGTVVGYCPNNFEKVRVAYVNLFDVSEPVIKTYNSSQLVKIDSPLYYLSVIAEYGNRSEAVQDDFFEAIEQGISDTIEDGGEDDDDGGGLVH
jgi:hypothetical protein